MQSAALHREAQTEDAGITGFSGGGLTGISFDTRRAEARATIMATMDRLASVPPTAPEIVVTDAHRAAVLARSPDASAKLVEVLAGIEARFYGGAA